MGRTVEERRLLWRERSARYRAVHRDAVNANHKQAMVRYREAHREELRRRAQEWREMHPLYRREKYDRYRAAHREQMNARSRQYWASLSSAAKRLRYKKHNLAAKYGLTIQDYDRQLSLQGGICAICGHPPKVRSLSVDHDHVTGRIRGLLCWSCNRILLPRGMSVEWLRHALIYAERPPFFEERYVPHLPTRKRKVVN
jgi:hypothetical protein